MRTYTASSSRTEDLAGGLCKTLVLIEADEGLWKIVEIDEIGENKGVLGGTVIDQEYVETDYAARRRFMERQREIFGEIICDPDAKDAEGAVDEDSIE